MTSKRKTPAVAGSIHPARGQSIREWHRQQILAPVESIAALHVHITADGHVETAGLGIEPEHAHIMVQELDSVRERLASFAKAHSSTRRSVPAEVIPFQRRA